MALRSTPKTIGFLGATAVLAAAATTMIVVRNTETPTRGTWEWDQVAEINPPIEGYRLRWSYDGRSWCENDRYDIPPDACGLAGGCRAEGICCAELEDPAGSPVFFAFTVYRGTEEGPTEHGPIVPCP